MPNENAAPSNMMPASAKRGMLLAVFGRVFCGVFEATVAIGVLDGEDGVTDCDVSTFGWVAPGGWASARETSVPCGVVATTVSFCNCDT